MNTPRVRKPHALYVAWGFPPSRGGGVYRALATANGLVKAGFDVSVLTCDRETFLRYTGADLTLESRVDPHIRIIRVPFDWPAMEFDIRRWDRRRARDSRAWLTERVQADRADFPETAYGPWARPLIEAAERIHRDHPVDLCIATANPNVDFAPAHHLNRTAGVPWVMDHRDAWTLDLYTEQEANTDEPRVAALEREYVSTAHEVWFVNDALRDWHRERYPEAADRILTVTNGYDPGLAPTPDSGGSPDAHRGLRFGYIGTMTPHMPMQEFVEGWALAHAEDPEMSRATAELWGYLGFYANPDTRLADLLRRYQRTGICYRGPVGKAEVQKRYADFDALLFIHWRSRFITSGKIFEYMASGLPIVSIHDPRLVVSDILRGYPLWFPARAMTATDISAALSEAAQAARETGVEQRLAAARYASRYERDRILSPRLQKLHDYVTAGRKDES